MAFLQILDVLILVLLHILNECDNYDSNEQTFKLCLVYYVTSPI